MLLMYIHRCKTEIIGIDLLKSFRSGQQHGESLLGSEKVHIASCFAHVPHFNLKHQKQFFVYLFRIVQAYTCLFCLDDTECIPFQQVSKGMQYLAVDSNAFHRNLQGTLHQWSLCLSLPSLPSSTMGCCHELRRSGRSSTACRNTPMVK